MKFSCPHCKRIALVSVKPNQATYFGGCRHVDRIEESRGVVRVVYANPENPRSQTISAAKATAVLDV